MKKILFFVLLLIPAVAGAQYGNRAISFYFKNPVAIGRQDTLNPISCAVLQIGKGDGTDTGGVTIPVVANDSTIKNQVRGLLYYDLSAQRVTYNNGSGPRRIPFEGANTMVSVGGNTLGAKLQLGTKDAFGIGFLCNGSEVAGVTTSGHYYGASLRNFTSVNNAWVRVSDSGVFASRDVADARPAFTASKAVVSGSIFEMVSADTLRGKFTATGFGYLARYLSIGSASLAPSHGITLDSAVNGYRHYYSADRITNTATGSLVFFGGGFTLSTNSTGSAICPPLNLATNGSVRMSIAAAGTITTDQDIEITNATKGIIMRSAGGTRYRVTVSDAAGGTLTVTLIP